MDITSTERDRSARLMIGALSAAGAMALWVSQPPWCLWLIGFVAVIPWLAIVCQKTPLGRREYFLIWVAGFLYWAISLQGLRHAHPVMYACWLALAVYLAVYLALFVVVARRLIVKRIPLWIAAPVAWVGLELVRNYLLTGISAAMLAHAMADVPVMIQIADIFGSYGVSFVVVAVNVAIFQVVQVALKRETLRQFAPALLLGVGLLVATIAYGRTKLLTPLPADPLAKFALIQRSETVEYEQDKAREQEIFQHYARQTVESLSAAHSDVDAVVWPESMLSGALPWMIAEPDAAVPPEAGFNAEELQEIIEENRTIFSLRANDLQAVIASVIPSQKTPHLIGGCGVLHYGQSIDAYSGIVHIAPNSMIPDWYGKTHLVMFGEYVPIISHIPGLRNLIPDGMGLAVGPGPKVFSVNGTTVAPNICIETAVERVTVNHLATLHNRNEMPDVVVTVTNDGWFDDSSVIDHHLRCAQLVAVSCRRPILSAANNGPTAWIDSNGQIVARIPTGDDGAVIATPNRDHRISLYLRLRDWPARLLALVCVYALFPIRKRKVA